MRTTFIAKMQARYGGGGVSELWSGTGQRKTHYAGIGICKQEDNETEIQLGRSGGSSGRAHINQSVGGKRFTTKGSLSAKINEGGNKETGDGEVAKN